MKLNSDSTNFSELSIEELNLLAPLRRPSGEFSNAAFVINLKADVRAPDAAEPARKDCNNKTIIKFQMYMLKVSFEPHSSNYNCDADLNEFWKHVRQVSHHSALYMRISYSKYTTNYAYAKKSSNPSFTRCC